MRSHSLAELRGLKLCVDAFCHLALCTGFGSNCKASRFLNYSCRPGDGTKFVGIWPMRISLLSEMTAMAQSDRFLFLISRGAFGCMPTSSDWEIG